MGLNGGADRDRTGDLKLAKLALSQLSYGPFGPVVQGQRSNETSIRRLRPITDS